MMSNIAFAAAFAATAATFYSPVISAKLRPKQFKLRVLEQVRHRITVEAADEKAARTIAFLQARRTGSLTPAWKPSPLANVHEADEFDVIHIEPVSASQIPSNLEEREHISMNDVIERETTYVLGRTAKETERLQTQAAFLQPFTERLFCDAGLEPGMKVLDIGSGAGDVALLAARKVGPKGAVIGIDTNPLILQTACDRVRDAGYNNVSFEAGDIRELSLPRDFDAVVGRLVLMYVSDPAAAMRAVTDHLRPGGIVAFQEPDLSQRAYAHPPSSLLDQIYNWLSTAFRESGADIEMGLKLRSLCLKAGLSDLHLEAERLIGGGADWGGYDHIAAVVTSVLPFLETRGIATTKEVEPETLAERLRNDIVSRDSTVVSLTLVRLCGRKPIIARQSILAAT
jgi:trans-aconitate methyltransferase